MSLSSLRSNSKSSCFKGWALGFFWIAWQYFLDLTSLAKLQEASMHCRGRKENQLELEAASLNISHYMRELKKDPTIKRPKKSYNSAKLQSFCSLLPVFSTWSGFGSYRWTYLSPEWTSWVLGMISTSTCFDSVIISVTPTIRILGNQIIFFFL